MQHSRSLFIKFFLKNSLSLLCYTIIKKSEEFVMAIPSEPQSTTAQIMQRLSDGKKVFRSKVDDAQKVAAPMIETVLDAGTEVAAHIGLAAASVATGLPLNKLGSYA